MTAECPALDPASLSTSWKKKNRRAAGWRKYCKMLASEHDMVTCTRHAQDAANTQQATLTGQGGLPPTPKRERTCWERCLEGVRGRGMWIWQDTLYTWSYKENALVYSDNLYTGCWSLKAAQITLSFGPRMEFQSNSLYYTTIKISYSFQSK